MNDVAITMMANVLASGLSIVALWALYSFAYRDYRVDKFRQRMFALRDELFDMAADGKIDFHSEAYGLLRTTCNGFIRFGDRVSLTTLVISAWAGQERGADPQDFENRVKTALSELTPTQQEALTGFLLRMDMLVIDHLVKVSPVLLPAVAPMVAWMYVKQYGSSVLRTAGIAKQGITRGWARRLDSLAFGYGTLTYA